MKVFRVFSLNFVFFFFFFFNQKYLCSVKVILIFMNYDKFTLSHLI